LTFRDEEIWKQSKDSAGCTVYCHSLRYYYVQFCSLKDLPAGKTSSEHRLTMVSIADAADGKRSRLHRRFENLKVTHSKTEFMTAKRQRAAEGVVRSFRGQGLGVERVLSSLRWMGRHKN